ncbi:MAG TPA: DUF222 domain-containing protein [Acidimicrobiales bacterium]
MFEVLAAAIEDIEIPVDRPALVEVLRLADQLEARISEAVGEFDARQLWRLDNDRSMVAWLMRRGKLAEAEARQVTSTAARLRGFPLTRRAWLDGVLSAGQVRAIAAAITDTTAPLYAQHEVDLVPALVGLDVRDTTTLMRTWVARPSVLPDGAGFSPEQRGDDTS